MIPRGGDGARPRQERFLALCLALAAAGGVAGGALEPDPARGTTARDRERSSARAGDRIGGARLGDRSSSARPGDRIGRARPADRIGGARLVSSPDIALLKQDETLDSSQVFNVDGAATVHTLETPRPGDGGTLTVTVEGDFGDLGEFADVILEGRSLGTVSNTADCAAATVAFALDAADLQAVAADGQVVVEIRNTPDVETFCLVNRHLVRLRYPSALDDLEFEPTFVGATRSLEVSIRNTGGDVLTVGSITTDDPGFAASPTAMTVGPGGTETLTLAFSPTVSGPSVASLTVRSDDPDEPEVTVRLHGEGLAPPRVEWLPAAIDERLVAGGSAVPRLTIRNGGGSDLRFRLSLRSLAELAPVGPRDAAGLQSRSGGGSAGPHREDGRLSRLAPEATASHVTEYSGTQLVVGVSNFGEVAPFQYPPGNEHLAVGATLSGYTIAYRVNGVSEVGVAAHSVQSGLFPVSHRETVNTPELVEVEATVVTVDGRVRIVRRIRFPRAEPYLTVETRVENASTELLSDVVFKAHADWDVDGDESGDDWDYDRTRQMVLAWDDTYVGLASAQAGAILDIYGWDDYSVAPTVVNFPSGPIADYDGYALLHLNLGELAPSSLATVTTVFGAAPDRRTLEQVIDEAIASASWLSVAPDSGTVPPGAEVNVAVTLDATRLAAGTYDAAIVIESNDLEAPESVVPVHLEVSGAPDIAISGTEVTVQSSMLYSVDAARTVHPLAVQTPTAGDGTLEIVVDGDYGQILEKATVYVDGTFVGAVGAVGNDCTRTSVRFALAADLLAAAAADGSVVVEVRNGTAVGFFCDVNRHVVRLHYLPASVLLDFGTGIAGQSRTLSNSIDNLGSDTLTVTSIATDGAGFAAAGGTLTVAAGRSAPLAVTFTPPGVGTFSGTLTIESDDPDEPVVTIPLTGVGVGAPDVLVAPASLDVTLPAGATVVRALTIHNTGGSDLEFAASLGPGADSDVSAEADGLTRRAPPGGTWRAEGASRAAPEGEATPAAGISLAGYQEGSRLRFAITEFGEVFPFQHPLGNEHLAVGGWYSGYTVAYAVDGVDRVCYAAYQERSCILPVATRVLLDTDAVFEAEVVTATDDSRLRIHRRFRFLRANAHVTVTTRIENASQAPATDVVFKEHLDWDVDGDFSDDEWDYDRGRNMVVASDITYVGLASAEVPALMDLQAWDDFRVRPTTVDFAVGPVRHYDGHEVHHFELGSLPPGSSRTLRLVLAAGLDLEELEREVDAGLTNADWISLAPVSGAVPVGSSQGIEATLDARTLTAGDYRAEILVSSNDPDEPRLAVPVRLRVTDASAGFPPQAVLLAPPESECDRPGAGAVALDASASRDPDSSPGTNDDIVLYEWFEDLGLASERLLGTGPLLAAVLPLGVHAASLRVTDAAGASDTAAALVGVADTTAPTLSIEVVPATLWPPAHQMETAKVSWVVLDVCDPAPAIALVSVTSSEPDDLAGSGDGSTAGDIGGADLGTADAEVELRAERDGRGRGRTYQLAYETVDAAGNRSTAVGAVSVPHDLRGTGTKR